MLTVGQPVCRRGARGEVGRVEFVRRSEVIGRLGDVIPVVRPVKVRWPSDPPNTRRWHAAGDLARVVAVEAHL